MTRLLFTLGLTLLANTLGARVCFYTGSRAFDSQPVALYTNECVQTFYPKRLARIRECHSLTQAEVEDAFPYFSLASTYLVLNTRGLCVNLADGTFVHFVEGGRENVVLGSLYDERTGVETLIVQSVMKTWEQPLQVLPTLRSHTTLIRFEPHKAPHVLWKSLEYHGGLLECITLDKNGIAIQTTTERLSFGCTTHLNANERVTLYMERVATRSGKLPHIISPARAPLSVSDEVGGFLSIDYAGKSAYYGLFYDFRQRPTGRELYQCALKHVGGQNEPRLIPTHYLWGAEETSNSRMIRTEVGAQAVEDALYVYQGGELSVCLKEENEATNHFLLLSTFRQERFCRGNARILPIDKPSTSGLHSK